MNVWRYFGAVVLLTGTRLRGRLTDGRDDHRERGDVPGWVMVTVMTAILVVAILGIFEPQIKAAISHALKSVTSSK